MCVCSVSVTMERVRTLNALPLFVLVDAIDSLCKWGWVLGIVRIVGVCQYVTLVSLCTYIE